jgi:hypothetical protein
MDRRGADCIAGHARGKGQRLDEKTSSKRVNSDGSIGVAQLRLLR